MALVMPHPSTDFQTGKPAPSIHSSDGAAWGGFSDLKKKRLSDLIDLQNKYIAASSEYGWLALTGKKEKRSWYSKQESRYNRLLIAINERIIWMLNR